jgi:hypothetical protein
MTQDQTVTNPPQSDHSPGRVMQTADGDRVPVPDLVELSARYGRAVGLADSLIGALQGISLDGLAELEDLTRLATGADPYVPGAPNYGPHLKISALRAFAAVMRAGEAADHAARHAHAHAHQHAHQHAQEHGPQHEQAEDVPPAEGGAGGRPE